MLRFARALLRWLRDQFAATVPAAPSGCPRCRGLGAVTADGEPIPLDRAYFGLPCPACRRVTVGDDTPRPRHTDAECRRAWGGMPVRCPVPHCGALLTSVPHVCPPRRGGRRKDEGFDVGEAGA